MVLTKWHWQNNTEKWYSKNEAGKVTLAKLCWKNSTGKIVLINGSDKSCR